MLQWIILLLLSINSYADDLGIRFNSAIPGNDSALLQFPPGGQPNGKMISAFYDWNFHPNFYLEGTLGYRSWDDVFEYSSMAYELSPGAKVSWGPLVMKLSEGLSYMPENSYDSVTKQGYQQLDFVTHLTIGLQDPKTHIGIYLDRAHYSNGYSENNPSLNYTGFMISFPLGSPKSYDIRY